MLIIRIIYNRYFDTSGLASGAARVTWSRHVTRAHATAAAPPPPRRADAGSGALWEGTFIHVH